MKQITAKRAVEALHWLHNNPHHIVGLEWPRNYHGNDIEKATHTFYQNYHEKLRVPRALQGEVSKYIRPNRRAFDTRMFALTPAGKRMILA